MVLSEHGLRGFPFIREIKTRLECVISQRRE